MRKVLSVLLAAAALAAAAAPAVAGTVDDEDDARYERRRERHDPPPPVRREAPPSGMRHGAQGQPYLSVLFGGFEPTNDDELDGLPGYDSAGAFHLGFGSRLSPVFAVEGSFGGYGAERGPSEANVVPVTVGGRLIIPNPVFEPYFGGGGGLYLASLKEYSRTTGNLLIDDDQAVLGGYFSMGADVWFNDHFALNLEGRHHWVNPEFTAVDGTRWDVEMSGWVLGAGVRFTF
jgi:opacity protein-like surface antigen